VRALYVLNDNFQFASVSLFHIPAPSPSSFYRPVNPKLVLPLL
jgi:hypothetical protein